MFRISTDYRRHFIYFSIDSICVYEGKLRGRFFSPCIVICPLYFEVPAIFNSQDQTIDKETEEKIVGSPNNAAHFHINVNIPIESNVLNFNGDCFIKASTTIEEHSTICNNGEDCQIFNIEDIPIVFEGQIEEQNIEKCNLEINVPPVNTKTVENYSVVLKTTLICPETPQQKDKRSIEREPFVLTSEK